MASGQVTGERRAEKLRKILRTRLWVPSAQLGSTRTYRYIVSSAVSSLRGLGTAVKMFVRNYAFALLPNTRIASRRLRILPIKGATSVVLFQIADELPSDIVVLAPTKSELRTWARDHRIRWKLGACISCHPLSPADRWPIGAHFAIRMLIACSISDGAMLWNNLVTSDDRVVGLRTWPRGFRPERAGPDVRRHRLMIAMGIAFPTTLAALHQIEAAGKPAGQYPPLGGEPSRVVSEKRDPAVARRRSVLFVNPSYYNFHFLADALRKRGWDAVSMAIVDPKSDHARHFHGHDWNLFEPDPIKQQQVLLERFREAAERFDTFHFAGVGTLSFFPYNYDTSMDHDRVPWDVLELKRRGAKIAYSITGCHDLVSQSGFETWSRGMCLKCVWRDRAEICSDHRMAAWGWKVRQLADLICIETDPPLDFREAASVFREPLSFAVDPDFWRPELARTVPVPEPWRESKAEGEIFVYHSVGNYDARTREGVNVKGAGAVLAAIERLKAEGHPVRLLFRKDVPSVHNRWMLAQADIIVDQLNYGRYGATAREGMFLGRPVVGRLSKVEPRGLPPVRAIAECPIVDASEETVYEVLRRLVTNPDERTRIGIESREHAMRWWSKDVLAERYERVYDHLRQHGRPPTTLE